MTKNKAQKESVKRAVIIGAGPAGLTAAYELLKRTQIRPLVIERDPTYVGGISKTVNFHGNRIDLGGHRFFSKSDRVMRWWSEILPISIPADIKSTDITYHRTIRALTDGLVLAEPGKSRGVMNIRPRKTRIYYGGKFFAYPIEPSLETFCKLGFVKTMRIMATYLLAVIHPIKPEVTLEDFFINRFGVELYRTFFKSYTEKVWGKSCKEMSAEWGAQRVKGLSITRALIHALKKMFRIGVLSGKSVEVSLIEQFLYPSLGPGEMWEAVAQKVSDRGGEIRMGTEVVQVKPQPDGTFFVTVRQGGIEEELHADYVFSTTDIKTLARILRHQIPQEVQEICAGLEYRDFLTVGLLLDRPLAESNGNPLEDTWIYIHEPSVHVGRIQIFNNWNRGLVADPRHGWIGLEYFVNEGDAIWSMDDATLIKMGTEEIRRIGLLGQSRVIDGTVIRQLKAYPGYFGTYERIDVARRYFDSIERLYLISRNGMHRYNNQDHSMLAALTAVDNIVSGETGKENIWSVNTEEEYHEEKRS